ncbi:pathogenicity island protein [Staphylococcus aureus]|uniref:pathogenicity island protein n=1 Tax=Staphylococcus aureus TaxID=1280 RepID=UPI001CD977DD|nr:pathogenicity island protein [Staphylococcus aureus]
MRKQVIITKTVVGWYNIKDTQHNLMLNIPPKVFEQYFPGVSKDVQVAVYRKCGALKYGFKHRWLIDFRDWS